MPVVVAGFGSVDVYYPEKPNNIVESLIPKRFPHAKIENKRLLDKICYNDNILS